MAMAAFFSAQPARAQGTMAHAQGTTYLSNLGQVSAGRFMVGSDFWIAQNFHTGTNAGGYSLKSVQLPTLPAVGNPSGFAVLVYSQSSINGIFPGSILGGLTGPDPTAGGTFNYNTGGLWLAPNEAFFLVATAATPTATGAFPWSFASSFFGAESSEGWGLSGFRWSSADGVNWNRVVGATFFQFAMIATAVPEPSSWLLLLLGLAGWRLWRSPSKPRDPLTKTR